MADPQDMILPLLRELRTEMRDGFGEKRRKFAEHDTRFDKIERRFDNLRQAVYGEPVLGCSAAAEVEDRLDAIENRLAAIASFEERIAALEAAP